MILLKLLFLRLSRSIRSGFGSGMAVDEERKVSGFVPLPVHIHGAMLWFCVGVVSLSNQALCTVMSEQVLHIPDKTPTAKTISDQVGKRRTDEVTPCEAAQRRRSRSADEAVD